MDKVTHSFIQQQQKNLFFNIYLEPLTPTLTNEKTFDTNTFVLKRKERRKITTPANENSFNEETSADLANKQSPSVCLDTRAMSAHVDPTRIM
jgi:hypothetical protein